MTRDSVYVYVCKSVKQKVCTTDSKSTQIAKSILAYVLYLDNSLYSTPTPNCLFGPWTETASSEEVRINAYLILSYVRDAKGGNKVKYQSISDETISQLKALTYRKGQNLRSCLNMEE